MDNLVNVNLYRSNINWHDSMEQTFEYYEVDPGTWKDIKRLTNITSSSVSRDAEVETLGSATINATETVGECYVRIYLVVSQNGITEKHSLGTFLVQTPSSSFNGKVRDVVMDAYTPLLELKENPPPIGYYIPEKSNVLEHASVITKEHVRAPVVEAYGTDELYKDFVSNTNDTWLTFVRDLLANAKHELALDELSRILFSPKQELASMQPVWTYDDSNSSILYPDITMDHDLFEIPNVVEVVFSNSYGCHYARVVNDDSNSPTSTISRGREILHRVTDPGLGDNPTNSQVQEYAENLLEQLSSAVYTVTYSHGYCPVRLGDCVRLNYSGSGITDVKAKVISQTIDCRPGCKVTETAVFTAKLFEINRGFGSGSAQHSGVTRG